MVTAKTHGRPGLAFLMAFVVAAVPYLGLASLAFALLYGQFENVTTGFKITFWAFFLAQLLASLSLCVIAARVLRLRLLPAIFGAACFLCIAAWPTLYFHSSVTSCEMGASYPFPGVSGGESCGR
jgi:hypothetical protein